MKRLALGTVLGVALLVTAGVGPTGAQVGYSPFRRPPVSPWINLIRPGTDPAVNYYGIIRPEVTYQNSIQQLYQQQTTLATQQQELATGSGLPATGHATGFQTQGKYFLRKGTVAPTTAAAPAGPAAAARPPSKTTSRR
jgi:hypothetical protein